MLPQRVFLNTFMGEWISIIRACSLYLSTPPCTESHFGSHCKHWVTFILRSHVLPILLPRTDKNRDWAIPTIWTHLSDHFKSGQRLSLQNRPTGLAVWD